MKFKRNKFKDDEPDDDKHKSLAPAPSSQLVPFVPSSPAAVPMESTAPPARCTLVPALGHGRQTDRHRRHASVPRYGQGDGWLGLGLRWGAALPPKPYAP